MEQKIVYSLGSNSLLAKAIAKKFNAELGEASVDHFADGELLVKTLTPVKGRDVIIIESTAKNAHEIILKLLLLIDSIKRCEPKSITLFIPYFGYSRQERVSWDNEPISCEVIAKVLDTAKVDRILTFDIHHPDAVKFFDTEFISIPTTSLFGEYYRNYLVKNDINPHDVCVVSPDHGSNLRSDALVKEIPGCRKVILNKRRPAPNFVEHFDVTDNDVRGKTCIIFDDIVDTGGTVISATDLLFSQGAAKVLVGASHAVLSNNALNLLLRSSITDIVVTNSIERELPNKIKVLDIAELIEE